MSVSRIIDKVRHWQRSREAINELLSRSDRELGDIGLRRCDVIRAVKGDARSGGR